MSKPSVSIDTIIVNIGTRKLELTLAEAQELKRILNETLEPRPIIPYFPSPQPIIVERPRYVPPQWEHPFPRWNGPRVIG